MANSARISAITNIMSEGGVSTKPPRRYPMFVVLLVARSNGTRPVPPGNVQRSTKVAAHRREISPERFPAKWIAVRVEKTCQNKQAGAPFRFNRNGKGSGARWDLVESPSRSRFLIEHDLRANALRLSRGKTAAHFSGSCSRLAERSDAFELQPRQPRIEAVGGDQRGMGAVFDDTALVHHQDPVAGQYSGEPMRDDQRGALAHQFFQRGLHQRLGFRVECRGCFIQQQ